MNVLKLHQDYTNTVIKITENAVSAIEQLVKKESNQSCLHVSIHGGGCSGFKYVFSVNSVLDVVHVESDNVVINDKNGNIILAIDKKSLEYLGGSTLHYVDELVGSKFMIVGNPNSTSGCGCGISFSPL